MPEADPADRTDAAIDPDLEAGVERILDHLKETRAFDFTGYKRATVIRRVVKRMEDVGIPDPSAYLDHLQVHPDEFEPLFNTILINVTSFFRDADAWSALRDVVIPELVARKPDGPIRVWSAGCSSGQEAYSTVLLLAEAIGMAGVRDRVKIYGTDVDEESLEQARQATYAGRELESLPPELDERWFVHAPGGRTLIPELRRSVIFGRHDLLQDAPISRVDLLLCRNTLMYFNTDVQGRLVHRLHFSLADGGFLLLGKVEMLLGQQELFEPVDVRRRLFRKLTLTTMRSRLLAMAGPGAVPVSIPNPERLLDATFEHGPEAQMVIGAEGAVIAVNTRARNLFGIPPETVGRPFQDLEVSYRPVELRASIEQARAEGRIVRLPEVPRWTPSGEPTMLDISVTPLVVGGHHLGVSLTFLDITRHRQLQDELEQTHREVEVAYEELQSANEELETTNEELQSTVEELETTNEELQSTNEELETMNEELSSTNEELHAINDELRDRTDEVDMVNAYLESVFTSFEGSVIVVDRELRIRVWNGQSLEMWGLHHEDVEGRELMGLEFGFPVAALRTRLDATLAGEPPGDAVEATATSRTGRAMTCVARVSRLLGPTGSIQGAIVLIEADRHRGPPSHPDPPRSGG